MKNTRFFFCLIGGGIVNVYGVACEKAEVVYREPAAKSGNVQAGLNPENSELDCPAFSKELRLISGLQTGWAMQKEDGSTVLQLGNFGFPCASSFSDIYRNTSACPVLWGVEIEFSEPFEGKEKISLDSSHKARLIHFEPASNGLGCARNNISSSNQTFRGDIHILKLNSECVVGEILNLEFPTMDIPELSGMFIAERC